MPQAAAPAAAAPAAVAPADSGQIKVQLTRQAVREKARVQIDTGQADQAIKNLNAVLSKFSDDEEARYLMGRAYEAKGNIEEALMNYERARTVRESYAARARVHREIRKDAAASEKAIDAGIKRFPDYVPLLNEKVIALINREAFSDAEPVARKVLTLPTGNTVQNRFYLAQAIYGLKKYAEARDLLTPIAEQTQLKGYAKAAKEYLESITFDEARAKADAAQSTGAKLPYSFMARLRGEYDSNVALYPDGELVKLPTGNKRRDDFHLVVEASGSYKFISNDVGSFGASANLFHSNGFKLKPFQSAAGGVGLFAQFSGGQGSGEWLVRNSLDASYGFFGNYGSDPDGSLNKTFRNFSLFSQSYALNSRGLYRFADQWLLAGTFQFSGTRFASDGDARSNYLFALNVGPAYETSRDVGGLRIDLAPGFKYRMAESRDYTMFGYGGALNLSYQATNEITCTAGTAFERRNHFKSIDSVAGALTPGGQTGPGNYSGKRMDNNLTWFAGTNWFVLNDGDLKGSLLLTYTGEKNLSNQKGGTSGGPDLRYSKHVISLGFGILM